ncbi:MAG: endonuclease NucS [Actinomycetaceae bacterium]|nr:endonuclease NucS [Actinomycetaceae bacterium]
MRLLVVKCSVQYSGRLDAFLPPAVRLVMVKADGSVLVHCDGGSYKPLNWMSPPLLFHETMPTKEEKAEGITQVWHVEHKKSDDKLLIYIYDVLRDDTYDLGEEPGLIKDGVEAHLQELLAKNVDLIAPGAQLVRREYPTPIGPVDLLLTDEEEGHIAVEVKRYADIDGVEQLTRYLEFLSRDSALLPLRGVLAARDIKTQARTLAEDRDIACVVLDYDEMRGLDHPEDRLF